MNLGESKCKPCEGGIPALSPDEISKMRHQIGPDWIIHDNLKLSKEYLFVNFSHTMDFIKKVADLSEQEGHHPVMHIYYGRAIIEFWTHSINGLSENDFIMAYKVDRI